MTEEVNAATAAEATGAGINYDQQATTQAQASTEQSAQTTQETQSQGNESHEAAETVPNETQSANDTTKPADESNKEAESNGVMGAYADTANEPPIVYEFKDAEGAVVNNETTALISDLAKDLNLSQEAAQKLFERGSGDDGIVSKINQNAIKHYNREWGRQIEADPELGGARLKDTQFNVAKAMSLDSTGELREFLKNSGLGNFPPLVKFLNKVGNQLNSDRNFITGKPAASQEKKDALASMYTSM